MRGFQHRQRHSPTVTLPPRNAALSCLAVSLLLCLLALSSSASALATGPVVTSLPGTSPTSTATASGSRIAHVTSAVTDTTPTSSVTQVASASDAAASAVEAGGRDLQGSKAPSSAGVRATVERPASSIESKAPSNIGVRATVERTASSIESKAPVKETVAPALTAVRQTVGGKVASTVTEGSTPVGGATPTATTTLAPASSAVRATSTAAKPGTSVADLTAAATGPTSEQGRSAGAAPGEQQGSAAHQESGTAAQVDRLRAQEAPPTSSSSRPWPGTAPAPHTVFPTNAPGAPRTRALGVQSPTASFPFRKSLGSHDGLADERGGSNTVQRSPSASPGPTPRHSPGAIGGYTGVAASAGAGGISIFLLIFGLLSVGGLMAMSLLRLASEPRRLAPIALIPERPD